MRSLWLEDVAPIRLRPPLDGPSDADVAILGAGFTGLWTALYLLERDPSLDVLVVEREFSGYGASGRNGAWCSPYINVEIAGLVRRFGEERGRALHRTMLDTVDEVGRRAEIEGIDAGYVRAGMLVVARDGAQEVEARAAVAAYAEHGFGGDYHYIDAEELTERIRISDARGALHCPRAATLHPGRLVRGLADAVERRGGRIVEGTNATGVSPRGERGSRPVLHTVRGDIRADTVVLAGEAYLAGLPGAERLLLPLCSLIVVTEPLPRGVWDLIGWEARELVASERLTVEYLARTEDGRVLFGGRGAPYRMGSRIDPGTEQHGPTLARIERALREWFPRLRDIRTTHHWGGVIGVPRDGLMTATHNPRTGLALGGGYTGGGVAASNLVGRILADLVLDRDTEITALPIVNRTLRPWPSEPLRWAGVRAVTGSFRALDALGERLDRPVPGRGVARRLLHG